MEKKIEDYLHLYLGCQIKRYGKSGNEHEQTVLDAYELNRISQETYPYLVKPVLRPLSSMTADDIYKFLCVKYWPMGWTVEVTGVNDRWFFFRTHNGLRRSKTKSDYFPLQLFSAEQTRCALTMGFDIYNLIPAGLAIDSTTLNPRATGQ